MGKKKESFWIAQSILNKDKIEVFTNKNDAIQYVCEVTGDTDLIFSDLGEKLVLVIEDMNTAPLYWIEEIKIRKNGKKTKKEENENA